MKELIKIFWDVLFLRAGPADVPYSKVLLAITVVVSFGLAMFSLFENPNFLYVSGKTLLIFGVSFAYVFLLLRMRNFQERFIQTITTLFGANILISCITIVVILFSIVTQTYLPQTVFTVALQYCVLISVIMLYIWTLVVTGHIFRSALEMTLGLGVFLAIGLEFIEMFIYRSL